MTDEINVTDSGPIEGMFKIDLSKGPGAYEFRGARGTGKTTLISSIDWLAGHKIDVTLHDGALSGKVEGFGVIAPIGGRKRRKGNFALDTIDAEKFSLSDLIDPPGKTPEVRDAHAIKALAVLSEVKADPTRYYELVGGQSVFDALGIDKTDDPVLLATRIKQAYEKQAKQSQRTAEAEAGHAKPLEYVPDGLDMSMSSDLESLGASRDEARDQIQTLTNDREAGQKTERAATEAKARLARVLGEYSGSAVDEAEKQRQAVIDKGKTAKADVEELERQLTAAKAKVEMLTTEYIAANQVFESSKSHAEAVSVLTETADQDVSYPCPEEIAQAQVAISAASQAYDQGIRIRDTKSNQGRAKGHRNAAKEAEKESAAAKNTAGQVFDVLAQSLSTSHLEIRTVDGNPRLFVQHPKRGRTAFDRVNGLSDGERVDFTLRELLPHIESPGLLPIPQRIWQDLQPSDRKNLHKLAIEKGLFLFGAQIDDKELRVVYLGDELELTDSEPDTPAQDREEVI